MLNEIKILQQNKVTEILRFIEKKQNFPKKVTFKAPTGSGKTIMMLDLMNRVLKENKKIIFLVSSLSISQLAAQVCWQFKTYINKFKKFKYIKCDNEPINVANPQNSLHIRDGFNVYVLPTDKYKKGSLLKDGSNGDILQNFLRNKINQGYQIYVIRDESHRETKNLNSLDDLFSVILNFSATPKTKPDIELSKQAAENISLIRKVELSNCERDDFGINKLIAIKKEYEKLLPEINPCLIIQIFNSKEGEEDWIKIKNILQENPTLQWASIIPSAPKLCETNSSELKNIAQNEWNQALKKPLCPVSVIIFKLVIKEGYDIPRACMLYQSRAFRRENKGYTTLDEQVLGRICRNPILLHWEDYSQEARKLALQAYAWGTIDNDHRSKLDVLLKDEKKFKIKIQTTHINNLWNRQFVAFDLSKFLKGKTKSSESIFELNAKWEELIKDDASIKKLKNMITTDDEWFLTCSNLKEIKTANERYLTNYNHSIEIDQNEIFLPKSSFWISNQKIAIDADYWPWKRYDGENIFDFDSEVEKKFFEKICKIFQKHLPDLEIFGKNFYLSDQKKAVKYGYVFDGPKLSFPDFILKIKGKIFIIEVKSRIDTGKLSKQNQQEYEQKISLLINAYQKTSQKIQNYIFMIAIKYQNGWQIYRFSNGKKQILQELNTKTFI